MTLANILNRSFLGNSVREWLAAAAIVSAVMLALWIIRHWLVSRLRRHAEQTRTPLDDLLLNLIERTRYPLLFLVALYLGALPLSLPDAVSGVIRIVAISTLLVQAGLWGNHAITFALTRWLAAEREEDPGAATTISALGFVSRLALWTVIVLLILDNLPNVEITSLIAGLGISGIAVALAVQNILQDLFASLSIVLDKPFVIGDFIIVDDLMGTVENIGLKTTRVRSLYGEELVFSNADLLGSRIRNYKRMHERRVVFSLGVVYETPYEKLAAIPDMLREIVEAQEMVRFDRAHFKTYGDFALLYEVVYYMLVPDYGVYMDTQQAINLEIFRRFQEEGIEFAYPTQTIYLGGGQQGKE